MDKSPSTLRAPDLGFLGVWQRIVFSPDGKLLAGRKGTGTLIVWDVATLRPQATLEQPLAPLAFSSAGESLRVAAPEQFEVVDVSSRRARRESVIPPSDLDLSRSALAYCETTGLLACQSEQGSLQLVDRATGQITPIPVAKDSVVNFGFSPRGDWFGTGELQLSNNVVNANGVIRLRDGRTGVALAALIHNTGLICSFAFSPDGLTLASGTSDAGITLWDMPKRKVVRTLKGHRQPVNGLAFSPDGKGLASGGSDGTVKLWRVAPDRQIDRELASINFAGNDPTTSRVNVGWVAFSPDGNTLAALSRDGNILRLWRAASGEEIKSTEAAGVR
jgi:WD40 repeat protein